MLLIIILSASRSRGISDAKIHLFSESTKKNYATRGIKHPMARFQQECQLTTSTLLWLGKEIVFSILSLFAAHNVLSLLYFDCYISICFTLLLLYLYSSIHTDKRDFVYTTRLPTDKESVSFWQKGTLFLTQRR